MADLLSSELAFIISQASIGFEINRTTLGIEGCDCKGWIESWSCHKVS
jgi:hypothetical protein